MEYLSVRDISKKWNMKERKVTSLCRDNRIPGVRKIQNTWYVPSDAIKPTDKRKKEYQEEKNIGTNKSTISYTASGAEQRVIDEYNKIFGNKPNYITFAPYTICPIGAHTDHNLGLTLSFAIDKGIHIAYSENKNGIIEIINLQLNKKVAWHVLQTPIEKQNDWADNLRGATITLLKKYPLRNGLTAVIDGELPIGGSSSNSAMILSFINVLAFLNNIKLDDMTLIDIAANSDTNYVEVNNGKLNEYSELLCKKDKLLFMDMKDEKYELIESNNNNFKVAIFFSGLENNLSSGNYNRRVEELRCTSYLLKAYSNLEYGRVNDSNMRDIDYDIFVKYKDRLPKNFIKRAEHFYEECERVKKGIIEFRNGNIVNFGKLMNESGYSSIHKWETGSKELIKLYEIIKNTKGVYGTRFSGAGFKGCCIAFIDSNKEQEVLKTVENEYLNEYPYLKGKYSHHICNMSDGMIID